MTASNTPITFFLSKYISITVLLLGCITCSMAQIPRLVKDINILSASSNAAFFTTSGSIVYFSATNELAQSCLYKTDGTGIGTQEVKPNIAIRGIADVNGIIFIADGNGGSTARLYISDGTNAGTIILKTFTGGFSNDITLLTNVNGMLFFKLGAQLWRSDGTAAGTILLKQFNAGVGSANSISNLINFNGMLVLSANTTTEGLELWKSDGTVAGTVLLKDIIPGTASGGPAGFCVANSSLYFTSWNVTPGLDAELWKTDGTDAGTVIIKDIRIGTGSSTPLNLVNVNGLLFFSADDGINGRELWKSDGTNAGTQLVKNINTDIASSSPANLTAVNNRVFFTAEDAGTAIALWTSDGTGAGTLKIPAAALNITAFKTLTNVNGTLFFRGTAAGIGRELFKSDGTDAGTVLVKDIATGLTSSNYDNGFAGADNFAILGTSILFGATNTTLGVEPWISNGSEAGTTIIKDIRDYTQASSPANLLDVNDVLFFSASDGTGNQLWKSDGTEAGTIVIRNTIGRFSNFCNVNGTLFYSEYPSFNDEIWKSDGTEAGTVRWEINPSPSAGSSPTSFINYNGLLYFFATNGTTGMELYKSDGTIAGTQIIKDSRPDNTDVSSPRPSIVIANNSMFYAFDNGTTGGELWKSDGTQAGTQLLKDINPGNAYSSPLNLININGTLFFTANNGVNGSELWKSDGTEAGTVMVKDITAGANSSGINSLVSFNNFLYFGVSSQLWRSDGSDAGTVMIQAFASTLNNLTNVGGTLFLTQNGALFKTDGTPGAAVPILNATGGVQMGSCTNLFAVYNTLYFSSLTNPLGATVASGVELWKCVSIENTATLMEINPGNVSSSPSKFVVSNGNLFFAATTAANNNELWSLAVGGGNPLTTNWTGAVSTAWEDAANWSTGLPGTTTSVIISAGKPRYPVINSNTTVKSITTAPNTSVNVAAGVTLVIAGN